ncbi:hypothetical protein [Halorarius litoreus]|uniref:hypothetical protein n=1 Tax=Halorarius litoreus TaxID=2962676 RepID=UPI0020CE358A|nr:hypothetical protein [Halorarius litoreus]
MTTPATSGSTTLRNLSVGVLLLEALNAARKGSWTVAAALLGAAALGYRYTGLGIVVELAIRLYQFLR